MAHLFPRLLSGAAAELHAKYGGVDVEELTRCAGTRHPAMYYAATGGSRLTEQRLQDLRDVIVAAAVERGFPEPLPRKHRRDFDVAIAQYLHRDAGIIPAEAVVGDLWAFLSLVVAPDVAKWRFPDFHKDRVRGTDVTRHVFGRLWWRAHLVHDVNAAPEDLYAALSTLGEAAFDQIYARRTSIGGSPHLVRGILRVWEEIDVPVAEVTERNLLRDFLKRLLRLNAFISFESLSDDELDEELGALASESVRALTDSA